MGTSNSNPPAILRSSQSPSLRSKSSGTAQRHLCTATSRILPTLLSCPSTSPHSSHHYNYTTETRRSTFLQPSLSAASLTCSLRSGRSFQIPPSLQYDPVSVPPTCPIEGRP